MPGPDDAAATIRLAAKEAPRIALVLGSGLGAIVERIADPVAVSYRDIPGFPIPGVPGHAGKLILGRLGALPIACLQGRVHLYEGVDPHAIRLPIRALKLAGCAGIVFTNAAGSMDPANPPGTLVAIRDHINFQGANPLVGDNDERFGPRFFAMRDAYDPEWRRRLQDAAAANRERLPEGVYAAYLGPNFETPAEIRAFRMLGCDVVGMSTVPEVLVARHCALKVAAVSVITNMAAGMSDEVLSHAHSLAGTTAAATRLGDLLVAFCNGLAKT
jgi:xanthosine phosphorylase